MILVVILLAGCSLALPTPEAEETDGEVSRKILGSSVVTSVSVIMDVGNGSQTYFSDAVGKPMTKPSAATQLASPINLLNPDRYEFYTFDDSGDLVKRLMTLDEIQGIIASGDGESANYNSQSLVGDEPEKRVDDVVNNVQNVLKEEMEAHKTEPKPTFDTPDITSTWNMMLPSIFGSSGENPAPNKQQNGATAETIMIEPTTLLPLNDTMEAKQTTNMVDVTTEPANMDTPVISVEINSNNAVMHDQAPVDSKTESEIVKETSRPVIVISTPAPFTTRKETLAPSTISTTPKASPKPTTTLLPLETSTLQTQAEITTPHGQLSTFFLIEDDKSTTNVFSTPAPFTLAEHKTESELLSASTERVYPLTTEKVADGDVKGNLNIDVLGDVVKSSSTTKPSSTDATVFSSTTIVTKPSTVDEDVRFSTPLHLQESTTTENFSTTKLSSTDATVFSSTTIVTKPSTMDGDLQFGTTPQLQEGTTTENFMVASTNRLTQETVFPVTEKPEDADVAFTKLTETTTENQAELLSTTYNTINETTVEALEFTTETASTTEQINATTKINLIPNSTEVASITESINLTSIINSTEVASTTEPINLTSIINSTEVASTTDPINLTSIINSAEVASTTDPINLTSIINSTETDSITEQINLTSTLKPQDNSSSTTPEANLVSSIEQLLSQAIGNPEQPIENVKEGQKINQVIQNINSKPMSQVQIETATAASALVGITPNTESIRNATLEDAQVNQAVDSLISQVIFHQPIQTSEAFTTTIANLEKTTAAINESSLANDDLINRYEEIDLVDIDSSTVSNFESKTVKTDYSHTTDVPEKTTVKIIEQNTITTSTELDQEETKHPSTLYSEIYGTTEKLAQDSFSTTTEIEDISDSSTTENLNQRDDPNNQTFSTTTSEEFPTSTENLEITSEINEPFLILTSSSEYPDFASTEIVDVYTKNPDYISTTSAENNFSTETITNSATQTQNLPETTQMNLKTDFGQTPTEKINFITTEEQIFVTTSQQPLSITTTDQPLISTTQEVVTTTQPSSTTILVTHPTEQTTTIVASPITPAFVNLPTISPKIDKPAELKLIQNITSSTTTVKPDMTWTLVSTVVPHKTVVNEETKTQAPHRQEPTSVDLVPKPLQGFGLEDSTSTLDTDVFQFTELCNELAFSFWSSVTSGISFARSVIVSPFAATSMLAMVFLGARGSTSGEMNDILKLDDMVTFNPHSIFKNVIESIEVSKKSGVAVSVFVKELYSDKNKGKLLNFYKERVKQFYDGHVEEANFKEINDVIRRRTNLLVKRQTWGKIPEYLKDNNLFARPPLAAVSANIFETDCSDASTEGRDGELHFVVLPSIRQRKLIPIPAVVWRSGFLAGYDPGLDATAVAIGTKDQTISTIFVIPGQQGISAPGDGLMRLEARLVESAFRQGGWSRLLRSLIPRPGLEVQIPRFAHKSVINATMALQRMGLKDLFNSNTADLKGLNGVAHELYLSDIVQVNTFATCGEGRIEETHHSEVYPATTNRSFRRIRKIQHYHHSDKPFENTDALEEPRDYQRAFHDPLYDPSYLSLPLKLRPRQARLPETPRLRFDRPFLYFVRHNPTGLILHMGRFNPRLLP